jgi:hypothetical protein
MAGLLKAPFMVIQQIVGYLPGNFLGLDVLFYKNGTANTGLSHHQKHTYALVETDLPFEIKIDKN